MRTFAAMLAAALLAASPAVLAEGKLEAPKRGAKPTKPAPTKSGNPKGAPKGPAWNMKDQKKS